MLKGFGYNIARSLGGVSFASFSKKRVLQLSSNNSTKHTCQSTIILFNLMFSWQKLFLSVFSFHQTNMLHCTTETWIPILGIDQWSSVTVKLLLSRSEFNFEMSLLKVNNPLTCIKRTFLHNFDTCKDHIPKLHCLEQIATNGWIIKALGCTFFTWNICICIGHLCFSNGNVRLRDSRTHFQK